MSRFVNRFGLAVLLVIASNAWALGLGDIRLKSALNQPLVAEIQLLSATPEELAELSVILAAPETFERYGLDRPAYLNDLTFEIIGSGAGAYVRVTSRQPMTEPFLTFLVEATWGRGRLLREYTVLLDPPTYAPPQPSREAVQAPQQTRQTDSGRIERPAPRPAPAPAQSAPAETTPAPRTTPPRPAPQPEPTPEPVSQTEPQSVPEPAPRDTTPYSDSTGGDYRVEESQTLWSIAREVRPDSRLTINQTMLAIYEANPDAFGGNINVLKAGARLTIPSADDIYRIDRGSALSEVQRQHDSWDGTPSAPAPAPVEEAPYEDEDSSSLTLVPPDEDDVGLGVSDDEAPVTEEPVSREDEILDRIDAIEMEAMPTQQSLIDIRNDELANLRRELAEIRGEEFIEPEPEPVAEEAVDPFVSETDEEPAVEEPAAEPVEEAAEEEPATEAPVPSDIIVQAPQSESIVDKVMGILADFWMFIVGGLVLIAGVIFWALRGRGSSDDDDDQAWAPLDSDDALESTTVTETQSIPPPDMTHEQTIVVEEQMSSTGAFEDTMEVEAVDESALDFNAPSGDTVETPAIDTPDPLEDTFSSETAVNLDQSDPVAEADFHMAYGLYDQAADLINGALQADPDNGELLTKLCEIYFVWGNRDAFVDAAQRVKAAAGGGESAEWDKIVIMGQQIAGDSELFAGAGVGATKEVDLSFDSDEGGDGGDLDMIFGDEDVEAAGGADDDGLDFVFDEAAADGDGVDETLEITQQTPTMELPQDEATAEMPTIEQPIDDDATEAVPMDEATAEMPAMDALNEATSEMPSLADTVETSSADATAEIDLDDLGLDLDALDDVMPDSLDDDEEDMEITGTHEALGDTGVNEQIDPNATGEMPAIDATAVDFDLDPTGTNEAIDDPQSEDDDQSHTDVKVDFDMLEATGKTQVLPESVKVETINEPLDADLSEMLSADETIQEKTAILGDDQETMLASLDDDDDPDTIADDAETLLASLDDDDDATMLAPGSSSDEDFDFAKTEALPSESFDSDATAEAPSLAGTDMDLDLDDLTAALDLAEADTVEMPRDDATVEQPRPGFGDEPTAEMPAFGMDEDDDLSEARTMTEVGTKLDLARAYIDMGDPGGARSILEEVLDEGDDEQRSQAQQLLDSLPG